MVEFARNEFGMCGIRAKLHLDRGQPTGGKAEGVFGKLSEIVILANVLWQQAAHIARGLAVQVRRAIEIGNECVWIHSLKPRYVLYQSVSRFGARRFD